jgi:hypothetical protein
MLIGLTLIPKDQFLVAGLWPGADQRFRELHERLPLDRGRG